MGVEKAGGVLLAAAVVLQGCAAPRLGDLKAGDEISIAAAAPRYRAVEIEFSNQAVGEDARTGAIGGATLGGLAGLWCGPLAIVCVPLGAMAVGASGGAFGALVGVAEGLPEPAREELMRKLQSQGGSAEFQGLLLAEISRKAGKRIKVLPAPVAHAMTIQLRNLSVHATREERISFFMRVDVGMAAGPAGARSLREKTFQYATPSTRLALWLDDSDQYAARRVREAIEHLADDIVTDLLQ